MILTEKTEVQIPQKGKETSTELPWFIVAPIIINVDCK